MEVAAQNQDKSLKGFFTRPDVNKKFAELLGKRSSAFVASVLQLAHSNDKLQHADPISVYQGAVMAATLDLPLNNNLGFAYLVPYNNRQQDGSFKVVAQFQIGYKGFIQLAQRSGQFKTISAKPVYDGQIVNDEGFEGFAFNWPGRKSDKVIGYAAHFSLINGFEKTLYMTVEELKAHGLRFSQSYSNQKTKANSLWEKDFESMAIKTVLKLLLSKYGPLSIEMQSAVLADQGVINDADTQDISYVDNGEEEPIDKESERITLMIEAANTPADLEALQPHLKEEHTATFKAKMNQLLDQEMVTK
jgi:recombination protein RecT